MNGIRARSILAFLFLITLAACAGGANHYRAIYEFNADCEGQGLGDLLWNNSPFEDAELREKITDSGKIPIASPSDSGCTHTHIDFDIILSKATRQKPVPSLSVGDAVPTIWPKRLPIEPIRDPGMNDDFYVGSKILRPANPLHVLISPNPNNRGFILNSRNRVLSQRVVKFGVNEIWTRITLNESGYPATVRVTRNLSKEKHVEDYVVRQIRNWLFHLEYEGGEPLTDKEYEVVVRVHSGSSRHKYNNGNPMENTESYYRKL